MPVHPERDPLPPLEWLRVFEAAARLASFTGAANELGLTQAAVSQRIRGLETRLDARLFRRLARGVELTAHGEAYLPHVRSALDTLRRGTADLFGSSRRTLTIAAPASVATLWIAPRIPEISESHPGVALQLSSVHRQTDFDATRADMEVRFGDGQWQGRDSLRLYEEVLTPVCAPSLLARSKDTQWKRLPLLSVSGPRDGWREWCAAHGSAPLATPAYRFDTFVTALAAAVRGAGVLLASLPLTSNFIDSGVLRRLEDRDLPMGRGYWLTWREDLTLSRSDRGVVEVLAGKSANTTPTMAGNTNPPAGIVGSKVNGNRVGS